MTKPWHGFTDLGYRSTPQTAYGCRAAQSGHGSTCRFWSFWWWKLWDFARLTMSFWWILSKETENPHQHNLEGWFQGKSTGNHDLASGKMGVNQVWDDPQTYSWHNSQLPAIIPIQPTSINQYNPWFKPLFLLATSPGFCGEIIIFCLHLPRRALRTTWLKICMYVCLSVCMSVCMSVCLYVRLHVCVYIYGNIWEYDTYEWLHKKYVSSDQLRQCQKPTEAVAPCIPKALLGNLRLECEHQTWLVLDS